MPDESLIAPQLQLRCSNCHFQLIEKYTGRLLGQHCRRCGTGLLLAVSKDYGKPLPENDRPPPRSTLTHPCAHCACPVLKRSHPFCRRCYARLPDILKRAAASLVPSLISRAATYLKSH